VSACLQHRERKRRGRAEMQAGPKVREGVHITSGIKQQGAGPVCEAGWMRRRPAAHLGRRGGKPDVPPHRHSQDAVEGGRHLVGAVGAPKLLDGLVSRPGQLQSDVAAAPLVGRTPVGLRQAGGQADGGLGIMLARISRQVLTRQRPTVQRPLQPSPH
jgi:hypothetical protein